MPHAPKIRAVVFDLDGLMLNTEDIFELAGVELLQRRGLQMTDDIRRGMMGRRAHEAFEVLKQKTGLLLSWVAKANEFHIKIGTVLTVAFRLASITQRCLRSSGNDQ